MTQPHFSSDWPSRFTDPYAVLGLSVSADDRRVLKRYRTVAKLLHPDGYAAADPALREVVGQMLARLVNPAYQRLKQEKDRSETMASLRIAVSRINQAGVMTPKSAIARQLLKTPVSNIEVFYEQAVSQLAEVQYQDLSQFEATTEQLGELNLTYLCLKIGEPAIRPKPTGLVPSQPARAAAAMAVSRESTTQPPPNYAFRHYQRAQEYMKKSNWPMAVQELRDAIRLEATRSEYHSLLAKAYLMQNLTGMATVHFRQALKLNPKDPLALQHAQKLKITVEPSSTPGTATVRKPINPNGNMPKSGGLFGLFARKR